MSLWTLTPLVAALLLGAHPGPVAGQGPVLTAATQANPSSPTLASVTAGTTPVLQQLGNGDWKTTVLVTGAGSGCPMAMDDYWLNTTSPDMTIQPKTNAVPVGRESGASCEITLTFAGQKIAVPATATLVLGGSSALPLAIARNIRSVGYIVFPLVGAFAMAILLLGLSLWRIRVYNWNREKQGPFSKRQANAPKLQRYVNKEFWRHEVFASGAWTLNDSWATNIATGIAVVMAAVGLVPATDLFFRGVALDRFSALSTIAGGIAAAAPLAVAVRYARWIRRHPGVTDDAELRPVATWPDTSRQLDQDRSLILTSGTLIAVEQGDLLEPDPADGKKPADQKPPADQKVRAQLAASAAARLTASPSATTASADGEWVVLLPSTKPPTVEMPGGTEVVLASGQRTKLRRTAVVDLPVGAAARIPAVEWDVLVVAVQAEDAGDRIAAAGWAVVLAEIQAEVKGDQANAGDQALGNPEGDPAMKIGVPSGATVTASWGATVCDQESIHPRAAHVQVGGKILVPPDSTIQVMASQIALPGGSDLMVSGTSVLRVSGRDPARPGGMLAISGSDVTLPKDASADDIQLPLPAIITSPFGAKVTVNGVAEVTVPLHTTVKTRYRKEFEIDNVRSHIRLPQSSNALAGTMGMILLAGLVTMLGIGMQIGIVAVLVGLSETTHWARALMWAGLFGLAAFTLHYSVTAIMALADPEPGSSMSTTAGASFTL
jgi:hypothetical protein